MGRRLWVQPVWASAPERRAEEGVGSYERRGSKALLAQQMVVRVLCAESQVQGERREGWKQVSRH